MKLSRHTRLTLELIGIAALAVGMGVGFGKLRQPSSVADSTDGQALAVEPALARVIAPAQPPVADVKPEVLPSPNSNQPDTLQLEFAQPEAVPPAPAAATVNEPANAEPPARAEDPEPPGAAAPHSVPMRAARRISRARKPAPSRAELPRAEAAPPPVAVEAPAPKPRAANAWDTEAYGGRR